MVDAPLNTALVDSITPPEVTDGFPGVATNVILNNAVDFGFNLTLTAGRDLLKLGNQGDQVYGGAERDTVFGFERGRLCRERRVDCLL
jgi:hypothetical protein